ncbi:MAG TPA: A/G-specific adenine glycosylase [Candidatus Deferrimicrobium sp.]|nr:A/G-specific adenine glycosylase [Candidatus Deferrimicrobium sp.]
MWTDGLEQWFAAEGRHHLPWRLTADPWPVLVSEVMLQQTSVSRVMPRWHRFLERWPTAAECAEESLDEVLREWQGLGYPRRARALWLLAALVTAHGWPRDEAGLRALPGIGVYTARALLAFSELGTKATEPPRDVNLGRVAARAALGCEPHQATPATLDGVLRDGRPDTMSMREYAYALFDVGATHCHSRPICDHCPLRGACAWRARGVDAIARMSPRRQAPYHGSLRQLRGAVLAEALRSPEATIAQLAAAVRETPGATPERVRAALDGLVADGLVAGETSQQR